MTIFILASATKLDDGHDIGETVSVYVIKVMVSSVFRISSETLGFWPFP